MTDEREPDWLAPTPPPAPAAAAIFPDDPPYGCTVPPRAWRTMISNARRDANERHRRAIGKHIERVRAGYYAGSEPDPPLPIVRERRADGLIVEWAVPKGEEPWSPAVSVYSPDRGRPSRADGAAYALTERVDLPGVGVQSVGAVAGGSVGGFALLEVTALVSPPGLAGLAMTAAGVAAGAGGAHVALASNRRKRWRTVTIADRSEPAIAVGVLQLVDAHGLAVGVTQRSDLPEAFLAVSAARALLWQLAEAAAYVGDSHVWLSEDDMAGLLRAAATLHGETQALHESIPAAPEPPSFWVRLTGRGRRQADRDTLRRVRAANHADRLAERTERTVEYGRDVVGELRAAREIREETAAELPPAGDPE